MSKHLIKQIKTFYLLDRESITKLFQQVCDEIFFVDFPEFKNKATILIGGSIANGFYDEHSDIDLSFIFHKEKDFKRYKWLIFDKYRTKNSIFKGTSANIHGCNIRYLDLVKEEFSTYAEDWRMKEYSAALVIHDPQKKFQALQKKYQWYTDNMYLEKIHWLFADTSFQIFDRYESAIKRNDQFYAECLKVRIIRNIGNALLLLNHEFPVNDKHLFHALLKLKKKPSQEVSLIVKLLDTKDIKKIYKLLIKLRSLIEKKLLKAKFIKRKKPRDWVNVHPKHEVRIGN